MSFLQSLFGKDRPFRIYDVGVCPHVYVAQKAQEGDPLRAKHISGYVVFLDKGKEATSTLKLALIPPLKGDNRTLFQHLGGKPDERTVITADNDQHLPWLMRWYRAGRFIMDVHSTRGVALREKAYSEGISTAATEALGKDMQSDHQLVEIKMNGDDNSLAKTIGLLDERGYLTAASLAALNTIVAAMNVDHPSKINRKALQALLEQVFKAHQTNKGRT